MKGTTVDGAVILYASLLPCMRDRAMELGYALTVHGSMRRDLDLVAVPWIDEAASPAELVEAIRSRVGGEISQPLPTAKPHGRLSWIVQLGGGAYIDLCVMPKVPA